MLVTDSGIVIDVSPLQFPKAELPMLVTDSGIVIDVSPVKPTQRQPGITLTLLANVKVVIFVSPLKTSESLMTQLSALKNTEVNPPQFPKAELPMLITDSGIVTDVNPVQP